MPIDVLKIKPRDWGNFSPALNSSYMSCGSGCSYAIAPLNVSCFSPTIRKQTFSHLIFVLIFNSLICIEFIWTLSEIQIYFICFSSKKPNCSVGVIHGTFCLCLPAWQALTCERLFKCPASALWSSRFTHTQQMILQTGCQSCSAMFVKGKNSHFSDVLPILLWLGNVPEKQHTGTETQLGGCSLRKKPGKPRVVSVDCMWTLKASEWSSQRPVDFTADKEAGIL